MVIFLVNIIDVYVIFRFGSSVYSDLMLLLKTNRHLKINSNILNYLKLNLSLLSTK